MYRSLARCDASIWGKLLGCFVVLGALGALHPLGWAWFDWRVWVQECPPVAEGAQWWEGRLALDHRAWDTAVDPDTGTIYNVFPPLLSIIGCVATMPLPWRDEPHHFPAALALLLFGLTLPVLIYCVFLRHAASTFWAVVLSIGYLAGTAVLPMLRGARSGDVYPLMHVLSQIGLLLIASEALRGRRIWLAALGLGMAVWSRQLTVFYAPLLFWLAWRSAEQARVTADTPAWDTLDLEAARRKRLAGAIAVCALIAAVPAALNWARFGSPLESGYALIYAGREHDPLAIDARTHGLFSTAFIPRNAYYMNAALPWKVPDNGGTPQWRPSEYGTSVWLTTPILAVILLGLPWWCRDATRTLLMACSIPIIVGHLTYHATGVVQTGYYRFALDWIPVWFVAASGWLTTGWRRIITVACVIWSAIYFRMIW